MITEDGCQPAKIEDVYPSRHGGRPKLIQRQDPVVYAKGASSNLIDDSLLKQYEEQGFLVLEGLFNEQEVACFRQELERLNSDEAIKATPETITEPSSDDVRSIFKIHEISPLFRMLATDIRLAGLAQYLLNDRVYIHQSRLNYKPGFRGKEFYWHSDFETWHVEDGMPRMRALSMSIALTENYDCNGPLLLIPGSHKEYVVCEGKTPAEHFKLSLKKQEYGVPSDDCLARLVGTDGIVAATGKPGSLILFDCNVMHGSNNNITPYPRSNVFFVYNAVSNRVEKPFCDQPPRPEYICSRNNIHVIEPEPLELGHE